MGPALLPPITVVLLTVNLSSGSTGPLIPRMQESYNVRIVSQSIGPMNLPALTDQLHCGVDDLRLQLCGATHFIFSSMFCRLFLKLLIQGCMCAAVMNLWVSDKFGFGWVRLFFLLFL